MVKTFRVIGMALLMMSVGIGFTSCGDDDDEIDGVKKENTLNSGYKDVTSVDKYCGTFYRYQLRTTEQNGENKTTNLKIDTRVRIEKLNNTDVIVYTDILTANNWEPYSTRECKKIKDLGHGQAFVMVSNTQSFIFIENGFLYKNVKPENVIEEEIFIPITDEDLAVLIEKQQKKDETTKPTEDEKVDEQPQDPTVDEPTQDPTKDDNQGDDNQETYVDLSQYEGTYLVTEYSDFSNGQPVNDMTVSINNSFLGFIVIDNNKGYLDIQMVLRDVKETNSSWSKSGNPDVVEPNTSGYIQDNQGRLIYMFNDNKLYYWTYDNNNDEDYTLYQLERR